MNTSVYPQYSLIDRHNLFIALALRSLRVMDLICFTEFPYTLFAPNISVFRLILLRRVLKRLHVCCVRLKGVDILTEVAVVFYADEILPEIRLSLGKNDICYRENVDVLLNFIRCKFIVASREQDGQCTYNVTSRRVRATVVAVGKQ
jgi:hypothetical protein